VTLTRAANEPSAHVPSSRCGQRLETWTRSPQLLPWPDQRQPDLLCLQETKLADEAFAELRG
jgi:exonuclease III